MAGAADVAGGWGMSLNLVAGFLTKDGIYAGEWAVACPTCGVDYSHVRKAGTLLGDGEGHVYPGTETIGETPDRRSAVAIVFDGECGHAWELRIQQHKGINLVQVQVLPPPEGPDE